jgi:hypothetical protein
MGVGVCIGRFLHWTVAVFLLPLSEGFVGVPCILPLLGVEDVGCHGIVVGRGGRRLLAF